MKIRKMITFVLVAVFLPILLAGAGFADIPRMTRDELQAIIDNAQNGSRVTMTGALSFSQETNDVHLTIPSGKTITLDLAGFQIVGNKYQTIVIEEGASLTLENNPSDSSFKVGTITKESNNGSYQGCIVNYGTFVLNSGTIKTEDYWVVDNLGQFTMNGGSLEADHLGKDYAVRNTGTFRMKNGTIKNKLAGVLNRGTFYLEGGSITNNKGFSSSPWSTSNTSAAVVNEGGTMVMSGGTISGNTMSKCGGIYNTSMGSDKYGSLTISGGTITGNEGRVGGVINSNDCSLTICGGEISGNWGRDTYGSSGDVCGGVLAYSGLNLYGSASVQGNRAEVDNTVPVSNLILLNGSKIKLTGKLSKDSRIGLCIWDYNSYRTTTSFPNIISENLTVNGTQRATLDNFPVDNPFTNTSEVIVAAICGGELAFSQNVTIKFESIDSTGNTSLDPVTAPIGTEIIMPEWTKAIPFGKYFDGWKNGGTVVSPGSTVTVGSYSTTYSAIWQEVWPQLLQQIADGGSSVSVKLSGNASKATYDAITVTNGRTLTLDLNGWELRSVSSGAIIVEEGGTLILKDSVGTGRITSAGATTSSYSVIENNGTVRIQGGSVGHGPFTALRNYGTVRMTGGGINGASGGYAVFNHPGATFTMSGGEMTGNVGAIENGGTFTLSGGSIHDNNAGATIQYTIRNGYLGDSARFVMTGGSIKDNVSSSVGGIYNTGNNSELLMSGGVISGNKGTSGGNYGAIGAIYVCGGSFVMTGGSITGNTGVGNITTSDYVYKQFCGGVKCQRPGTFSISGKADISGNIAVHSGNEAITRNVDVTLETPAAIRISGPLDPSVHICLWPRTIGGYKEYKIVTDAVPEEGFPWAAPSNFTITNDDLKTWKIIPYQGNLVLAQSFTNIYYPEVIDTPQFALPESVTRIQSEAFAGTSPAYVCIPESSKKVSIDSGAFKNCKALRQIQIPANVTAIAEDAFDSRSIIYIYGKSGSTAETFAEGNPNCFFIIR